MNGRDWREIVATVAPGIATALGGPLAGMAVSALSGKLLGRTNGTQDEVAAAVMAGGGDVMLKLKEADQAFALRMGQLGIDMEKVHQADRNSAREREAKTGDTFTPQSLAYLVTAGFFGVLAWLLAVGKPEHGGDALLVMLGALGTAWGGVINYYFGSSSGSAQKTEIMNRKTP